MRENIEYRIEKKIAVLSKRETERSTFTKEVNLISFNGREPKIDIRNWRYGGEEETVMLKGIDLTAEETATLAAVLQKELSESAMS